MTHGSLVGRAPRASTTDPRAMGECDYCRFWYAKDQLSWQYQWAGPSLINTGFLVCRRCLDVPQEQYRTIILPGDPRPVQDPRPSPNVTPAAFNPQQALGVPSNPYIPRPTDPYNQGFTPFNLGGVSPSRTPWVAAQGTPQVGGYPPGFPGTKAGVLAALAGVSGIPTPPQIFDRSTTIVKPGVSQTLMVAQPARGWLLMFSPAGPLSGFSPGGPALLGATTTLLFGAGMAWFWATAQGLGPVWTGSLSIAGLTAGMPLWAWESGYPVLWLTDDFGKLITDDNGRAIPLT